MRNLALRLAFLFARHETSIRVLTLRRDYVVVQTPDGRVLWFENNNDIISIISEMIEEEGATEMAKGRILGIELRGNHVWAEIETNGGTARKTVQLWDKPSWVFMCEKCGFNLPQSLKGQMLGDAKQELRKLYRKLSVKEEPQTIEALKEKIEEVKNEMANEKQAAKAAQQKGEPIMSNQTTSANSAGASVPFFTNIHNHTTGWAYKNVCTPVGHFAQTWAWDSKYGVKNTYSKVSGWLKQGWNWITGSTLKRETSCGVAAAVCYGIAVATPITWVYAIPAVSLPYAARGIKLATPIVVKHTVKAYKATTSYITSFFSSPIPCPTYPTDFDSAVAFSD